MYKPGIYQEVESNGLVCYIILSRVNTIYTFHEITDSRMADKPYTVVNFCRQKPIIDIEKLIKLKPENYRQVIEMLFFNVSLIFDSDVPRNHR
jgi:hypothetical protein